MFLNLLMLVISQNCIAYGVLMGKWRWPARKEQVLDPPEDLHFGVVAVAGRIHLQLASAQFIRWVFGHHSQPLHRSDMCVHCTSLRSHLVLLVARSD